MQAWQTDVNGEARRLYKLDLLLSRERESVQELDSAGYKKFEELTDFVFHAAEGAFQLCGGVAKGPDGGVQFIFQLFAAFGI